MAAGTPDILSKIVAHKRIEVAARMAARPEAQLREELPSAPASLDFAAALVDPGKPAPRVIAEIKRRSPSKGVLREGIEPAAIARIYMENGASTISVLCDNRFFGGSLDDMAEVRGAVRLPLLCKEFIVDPYQIIEARIAGADAILLLASVLTMQSLRDLRELCELLGMAALVEVHSGPELLSALLSGAGIIGINNRDLHTFAVDTGTTASLMPYIPEGVIVVSESGIRSVADREKMGVLGVHALLIGEGLIAAPDIAAATREMCGLLQGAII